MPLMAFTREIDFAGENSYSMDIGYARVSTTDQDTDMQLRALANAGVRRVYHEAASSVGRRPRLQEAIAALRPGDTLVVYKLDRLARSLRDLLTILDRLEGAQARFRSLTESIDTSTAAGRMMMQMLGAFAEFERSLIRERSIAGQLAARARGNLPGRPRSMNDQLELELVQMYQTDMFTMHTLSQIYNVHPSSVKRAIYRKTKPGHSSLK
jgi:DNA invertase Pin-like site-specific DNA recombinase